MVILDELGSGTDPAEGMGIAIAILEELKNSGALFLATTHYPEVKAYAEKEPSIVNARMTFDKENLKPLYQMVIGEAGESCAFYIAGRLGMPAAILQRAAKEAYGTSSELKHWEAGNAPIELKKDTTPSLTRRKTARLKRDIPYNRGDSVMIYPDKKIGIVCEPANEKGILRIQLPNRKLWISHKRVKLLVAAEELYPEEYDFSIVFDTVANRKLRHQMTRKHVEGKEITSEE